MQQGRWSSLLGEPETSDELAEKRWSRSPQGWSSSASQRCKSILYLTTELPVCNLDLKRHPIGKWFQMSTSRTKVIICCFVVICMILFQRRHHCFHGKSTTTRNCYGKIKPKENIRRSTIFWKSASDENSAAFLRLESRDEKLDFINQVRGLKGSSIHMYQACCILLRCKDQVINCKICKVSAKSNEFHCQHAETMLTTSWPNSSKACQVYTMTNKYILKVRSTEPQSSSLPGCEVPRAHMFNTPSNHPTRRKNAQHFHQI